jgi:hypothetical protein
MESLSLTIFISKSYFVSRESSIKGTDCRRTGIVRVVAHNNFGLAPA